MSHRKYGLDHLGCRTARRLVSPALALWLCSQPFAARADLYFNPRFLADDPAAVADLSGFEKGQEVPPGTYRVDIYLNNGFMTTRDVTFQADAQGHGLSPCLTRGQLASMGVDTGRVPGMATLDSTAWRAADHAYQRSYHALRRRTAAPVPHRPPGIYG